MYSGCTCWYESLHVCTSGVARAGDGKRYEEKARINALWERCTKEKDTNVEIGSPAVFFCSKIFIQTALCLLILERNLDSLCS